MLLADSVGLALLVVLETLAPAERVAFVLHDMFDLPFDQIGPDRGALPGRGPPAGQPRPPPRAGSGRDPDADLARQREVVDAFLAASRGGDFGALVAVLDPEVVLRADAAAVRAGASGRGSRRGRGGRHLLRPGPRRAAGARERGRGAVWLQRGQPRMVFGFTISGGKIVAIDMLADPERIRQLDLVVLRGG